MIVQGVSISEMLNQSIQVLTKPSIQTLEQYERRGGQKEGLTYVGVAAVIAGIAGLLGVIFTKGLIAGVLSLIFNALLVLVGFFIFVNIVHFVGTKQGGTGTLNEVYYTFALIVAPILAITQIVSAIPVIGFLLIPLTFLLGIYQLYLSYLGIRSSMNIEQTPAIITIVVAFVAQLIAGGIIGAILATIVAGLAVAAG